MEEVEAIEILEQQHLPHDLVAQHILTRLPIKSLLKFKCVAKQWYSTISSYHFAHTHFKLCPFNHPNSPTQFLFVQNRSNYYLFAYDNGNEIGATVDKNLVNLRINFHDDELVLVGSCNGLVCLASYCGFYFILWNPITGQFCKYLDHELLVDFSSKFRVSWGFGYVSCVDDYRIVRILESIATVEIRVHVFSLRTKKWRRIDDEVYQDIFSLRTKNHVSIGTDSFRVPVSFYSRQGVLVNETLYWIVSKTNDWGRKVVSFDLVHEMFDTVSDLSLVSNDAFKDKFLCVMGGCLSKFGVSIHDDVYIGILKGPGKVESIRLSKYLRLRSCQSFVGFTKSRGFFILLEDSTIGVVNPTSQPMKYKYTPLVTFESLGKTRVANYAPSLISPYTVA